MELLFSAPYLLESKAELNIPDIPFTVLFPFLKEGKGKFFKKENIYILWKNGISVTPTAYFKYKEKILDYHQVRAQETVSVRITLFSPYTHISI